MTEASELEPPRYSPPARVQRRYVLKKALAFLAYVCTAMFVVWLFWPGLTSAPALSTDYLTMMAALFMIAVGLALLVVITWNERLVLIEDGRMTWPFPYRRSSGKRTRYVPLDEIAEARRVASPDARRGLELVLRDGTQMFLPQSVLRDNNSDVLDRIVHYASRNSREPPSKE